MAFQSATRLESVIRIPSRSEVWSTVDHLCIPKPIELVATALKSIKSQGSDKFYTPDGEWDILVIFRDLLRIQGGKREPKSPRNIVGVNQCCPFDLKEFASHFSAEDWKDTRAWIQDSNLWGAPRWPWHACCRETLRFWSLYFEVSSFPQVRLSAPY